MARQPDRLKLRGRTWWTWFYVPEVLEDGRVTKRKIEASTGQRDRALAREAARRIEVEHAKRRDAPAALSVADVIAGYLAHCEAVDRAPDTLAFYARKGGHVVRLLGADVDVHTLGPAHADAYLARRKGEGAKLATVAKELGVLRSALTFAKRRRTYHADPDWCMPPELRGAYTPRERALTLPEYQALRAALAPRRRGVVDYRDHLALYVGCGPRDSELYRISAEDWSGGRLHIRGRKTSRADRWITPPPDVAAILDRRAQERRSGPLFERWTNVRRDLAEACKRASEGREVPIAPVSPNDLRRTFATWLAERGVPELVTASLMGHANSAMVRRVYARIGASAQIDAIARMPGLT